MESVNQPLKKKEGTMRGLESTGAAGYTTKKKSDFRKGRGGAAPYKR